MKTRILLLLLAVLASLPAVAYEPADNAGLSKKEQRRTFGDITVLWTWGMLSM